MGTKLTLLLFMCFGFFVLKAQEIPSGQPETVVKTIYATYYAKKFEGRKTTSGQRYFSWQSKFNCTADGT